MFLIKNYKKIKMQNNFIKDYLIETELGAGGMAVVYLAEHRLLQSKVAIKILNFEFVKNENIRKRFLSEARNMARMSHPNIIKVTDLIDQGDTIALVMEYVSGETLKDYIEQNAKLSNEDLKSIFIQMLEAVSFVHKNNLIHRDIKPSNFMISREGQIKLLDFGIAKNADSNSAEYTQTGTGMQMGTPLYMSPEQILETKGVTAQTDIYSLGVVLWQMITGRKPYDSKTLSNFQLQTKIVNEALPLTGTKWDSIIQKATEKELLKRYLSCDDFQNDIGIFESTDKSKNDSIEISSLLTNENSNYDDVTVMNEFFSGAVPPIIKKMPSNKLNIDWVDIPGGTFLMGSPIFEKDRMVDEVQHEVSLSPFKMSRYPITFKQYDAFCKATGFEQPSDKDWGRGKRPVINVNWDDATTFAEWLGYLLPTEAEWEYACRAGSRNAYITGNRLSVTQANFNEQMTTEVGRFEPNSCGLFDMHGNVWEWCNDWYGEYPKITQINPKGPVSGTHRVYRGGSWSSSVDKCRFANRGNCRPAARRNTIGFRLVTN